MLEKIGPSGPTEAGVRNWQKQLARHRDIDPLDGTHLILEK